MSDTSMIFNILGRDAVSAALVKIRTQISATAASVERIGKSDGFASLNRGVDSAASKMLTLAKASTAIVTSMSGAQSAVGVAAALSGTLGLIPAGAVAGGTALAALKVGVSGFGQALKDSGDATKFAADLKTLAPAARQTAVEIKAMHPALATLKKDVQGNLFTGFATQVKTLGAKYLPTVDKNLSGVAAGFNKAATGIGSYLTKGRQVGLVSTLLGQSRTAATNVTKALQPAVSILLNVASAGGSFLPRLTSGLGNAATAAARFVANARQTGRLQDWISTALDTLKQLGTILRNIGSVVAEVFGQFSSAGAGVIPMLVRLTGQVSAFMHSAEGQEALTSLASALSTVSGVASGVFGTALRTVAPLVVQLAPTVATLATQVGGALTVAIQKAGPLLAQLATVLQNNISWLGPLLIALAAGTKGFFLFAGAVKTVKGAVDTVKGVGAAVNGFGKAVGKIGATVGKGIGWLGRLSGSAVSTAARIGSSAASTAASWSAAAARTTASLATTAAQFVAQGARMAATAALTAARVVAGWVVMGVQSLIQAGRMAVAWVIAMGPIALVVAAVVAVVALIVTHWNQVRAVTVAVFTAVGHAISTAVQFVIGFVKRNWPLLVGILLGPIGAVVGLIVTHWNQIKRVFSAGVAAAVSLVRGLPGKIVSALGNLGGLLVHAGASIVQGLWHGITSLAGWLKNKVLGWIKSVIPGPIASALGIASPSKVAADLAAQVPRGVGVGIDRTTGVAVAATRRMVGQVRAGLGDMVVAGQAGAGGAGAGGGAGRGGAGRGGGGALRVLPGADQAVATMIMNLVRSGKLQLVVA